MSQMRTLVDPPPSVNCALCKGELLVRHIEPNSAVPDMEIQNFVCAICGCEYSRMVKHDRYAAHAAKNMPPAELGQPDTRSNDRHV
jgi:hypothetical protein